MNDTTPSVPTSDRFETAPVGALIGMKVLPSQEMGTATVTLEVTTDHHNPMGTVHGGVMALLADTAMGVAFGRTLQDDQTFGTVDLRIDFIRPVALASLTAVGTIVKRGSRIGFIKAEIHNEKKKLVASANCTCLVISLEP